MPPGETVLFQIYRVSPTSGLPIFATAGAAHGGFYAPDKDRWLSAEPGRKPQVAGRPVTASRFVEASQNAGYPAAGFWLLRRRNPQSTVSIALSGIIDICGMRFAKCDRATALADRQ